MGALGPNGHNSISFKVRENDRTGPQDKVLHWVKGNFGSIRWDLADIDWVRLSGGKGMSGKWAEFKSAIA